ncbi:Uncharacterised protein [uncultured archaeon]|nr:Uncharacterised protein [uncultured archaeon]
MKKGVKDRRFTRGQITIFIILAIVVVAGVGVYLYALNSSRNDCGLDPLCKIGVKPEINIIKNSIYECEKETGMSAIKTIGIQGGFYKKPQYFHDIDWAFIPYYYYDGGYFMPQKNIVEGELSSYMNENLKLCIDNLQFNSYTFEYPDPKSMSFVTPGKVSFTVDLPINLKKGDKSTLIQLKDSPVVFNSSLYESLEVADYITKTHQENNSMLCINCVVSMAKERNLYVDMMQYPNLKSTTLVMISENHTSTEPYIFEFLNKYV